MLLPPRFVTTPGHAAPPWHGFNGNIGFNDNVKERMLMPSFNKFYEPLLENDTSHGSLEPLS